VLAEGPTNWGRWGPDDEIGVLNEIGPADLLAAVACVRQGRVFTLGLKLADPAGDPVSPGREPARRTNVRDKSTYLGGAAQPTPGGIQYADDTITMYLQGTTHVDALGHDWYGEHLYNGYDARTTIGMLERASALPIAERGIVGRGVLLDVARARGKEHLERDEGFDLDDLIETARAQGLAFRDHDCILVRTGWLETYYTDGADAYYAEPFVEPGLHYSPELALWFREHDFSVFGTDTMSNEFGADPDQALDSPLHASLMRNLGVVFMEMLSLQKLATACATSERYEFLFVAAPLKVVGATGGPVNPIAVL
jgi:kynurenine formamidase